MLHCTFRNAGKYMNHTGTESNWESKLRVKKF